MEATRQYTSCVAESVAALKQAHDEVTTKQVADTILLASRTTLDSIETLETNHKRIVSSLTARLTAYEDTIEKLVAASIASVRDTVENTAILVGVSESCGDTSDVSKRTDVASMMAGLVQVALQGLERSNNIALTDDLGSEADLMSPADRLDSNPSQAVHQSPPAEGNLSKVDGLNESRNCSDDERGDCSAPCTDARPFSPTAATDIDDESVTSISAWFRKISRESKNTISALSDALANVSSEREQFRSEVAMLRATCVPATELAASKVRVAKLEGDLRTAHTEALTLAAELSANAAKDLAEREAEKTALTAQIDALSLQIESMRRETDALESERQQQRQQLGAGASLAALIPAVGSSFNKQALSEALEDYERVASIAAEATAKMDQLPQIEYQLECAKRASESYEAECRRQKEHLEAFQQDMNAVLYQNSVLTQQLAESLSTNAKMAATAFATRIISTTNGTNGVAPSDHSSSVAGAEHNAPTRRWLYMRGSAKGSAVVTPASHTVPSHDGIGLKSVRSDDDCWNVMTTLVDSRNRLLLGGVDARNNSVRPLSTAGVSMCDVGQCGLFTPSGALSAASSSFVATAFSRQMDRRRLNHSSASCCVAGYNGAAIADTSSGSDGEMGAAAAGDSSLALQLAGFSVSDITALVQQNSLLVALLYEQRCEWTAVIDAMQLVAVSKEKAFRELLLMSDTPLARLAQRCVDSLSTTASAAKRSRVESAHSVTAEHLLSTEQSVFTTVEKASMSMNFFNSKSENDLPSIDDIISGCASADPTMLSRRSAFDSYAAVKNELRSLLGMTSSDTSHEITNSPLSISADDTANEYTHCADGQRFVKAGKMYVSEGTSPDYTILAAESLAIKSEAMKASVNITNLANTTAHLAVEGAARTLRQRVDTLASTALTMTNTWCELFAAHVTYDNADKASNGSQSSSDDFMSFGSVTTITVNALRNSLASYAGICTELDCEVSVLRAKVSAYEKQVTALEDVLALNASNDVSNFNALQHMSDYLTQAIASVGEPQNIQASMCAQSAVGSSSVSDGAGDPAALHIMNTFANVLEVLNATQSREETLADIFVRTCAAFRSNPRLAVQLEAFKKSQQAEADARSGVTHPADEARACACVDNCNQIETIPQLVDCETNRTCTFNHWRSFTSDNTAIGATTTIVASELRAALEAETERADYFQDRFEQAAAQHQEWIEHLFVTDQKCSDIEAQLNETQSTMITRDEHTRVLIEFEGTLARKRDADELIAALQTSIAARDGDISRLVAKCKEVEDQLLKNDADHRKYEQAIRSQMETLQLQISDRDHNISQLKSILTQTQTQVSVVKMTVANRDEKIAQLEHTLQMLRHETIESAYKNGILSQMFPNEEQAMALILESAENKRLEATMHLVEIENLHGRLRRCENDLQTSEASRTTESSQRQRLELLLSQSEATVKSYYDNVEEAIGALKVKCEALERQLSSVTRERDATIVREEALREQVAVLGADPTTENVRRYGLAATRLFEAQMTELNDRYVATQAQLVDTQNDLAATKADRDAQIKNLTTQKKAVEDALEQQQNVSLRIADEKEQLGEDHNALHAEHEQLLHESRQQQKSLEALEEKKTALLKLNEDTTKMLDSLRKDNTSLLSVTESLRLTVDKFKTAEANHTRVMEELKLGNANLRVKLQEAATASASAVAAAAAAGGRTRPSHRAMQTRPQY